MLEPRIDLRRIPLATAIATTGGVAGNVVILKVAERYGTLTIGVGETVLFSVIGALLAAAVFAALGKMTPYAVRWFTILATIAIAVYGVGPIAAAYEPYMEGAPLFTLTTVVATELMHINSGAWILVALLRFTRAPLAPTH
ncbi:MAG: hypothetical protein K2R93_02305 [Gemmatimonadaceae bacterium]|nr:hypothetical protein [Gemmatimonadaceae bacterium]